MRPADSRATPIPLWTRWDPGRPLIVPQRWDWPSAGRSGVRHLRRQCTASGQRPVARGVTARAGAATCWLTLARRILDGQWSLREAQPPAVEGTILRQLAGRLGNRRLRNGGFLVGLVVFAMIGALAAHGGNLRTRVGDHKVLSGQPGRLAALTPGVEQGGETARGGPTRKRSQLSGLASPGEDLSGPLALIASDPEDQLSGRSDGTTTGGSGVGGLGIGPGAGPPADPRGGGVWPDSSSPVRNAPSNSTTGPAIPPVFSLPGWTVSKVVLPDGSRLRYYLLARPAAVSAAHLPVLMVLPGRNMTPSTIARASGFLRLVGQAVVVFPAGFANSWNAGYCCGVAHLAGVNDVAFLENVVRSVLSREPGTSSGDVYIAGFSNGGRMALDMACADPRAFKGVAAVEAVAVSSCSHTSPVPLLDIASTADPLLTIGLDARPKHIAGHTEITVQAMIDHWRAIEGCSLRGERNVYPVMTYTMWPHCSSGSRVALAVYDGGPHVWPRGGPGSPPAQTVIWDFFHGVTPAAASRSANAA